MTLHAWIKIFKNVGIDNKLLWLLIFFDDTFLETQVKILINNGKFTQLIAFQIFKSGYNWSVLMGIIFVLLLQWSNKCDYYYEEEDEIKM